MLTKDTSLDKLQERLEKLTIINVKITKDLNNCPPGNLRLMKQGRNTQYFHITQKGDTIGQYLSKSNMSTITKLAQKDYLNKAQKLVEAEIKQISFFIKHYEPGKLEHLKQTLREERQQLITPIFLTDDEFANQWKAKAFSKKKFTNDVPEHFTLNGERVRSKSEVIIANTLSTLGIPYRYEAQLKLNITESTYITTETPTQNIKQHLPRNADKSKKSAKLTAPISKTITVHPDFTCLNKRTRQEFIWEHFGMMDKQDYANNAIEKERIYAAAGYIPGVNFIATTETTEIPLNIPYVEQIAKKLLL